MPIDAIIIQIRKERNRQIDRKQKKYQIKQMNRQNTDRKWTEKIEGNWIKYNDGSERKNYESKICTNNTD